MSYFLCHWHDGSDASHTIIRRGSDEVQAWLIGCLRAAYIGYPKWINDQLETLDDDAGLGREPVKITWAGKDHAYSITEITDLGSLSVPDTGLDEGARKTVAAQVRKARNWLNSDWFKPRASARAMTELDVALYLLGAPVDG